MNEIKEHEKNKPLFFRKKWENWYEEYEKLKNREQRIEESQIDVRRYKNFVYHHLPLAAKKSSLKGDELIFYLKVFIRNFEQVKGE